MNLPEPLRRSSSIASASDYAPASLFPSTARLVPSRRPSEVPTPLEEGPTGGTGVEHFDMPHRRPSDIASTSSSTTRTDHASRRNTARPASMDGGGLTTYQEKTSSDITPASPTVYALSPAPSIPYSNTPPPLPTPAAVKANPKLAKPAIPRYLTARSPSPIPDFIDTGVKGTPPPSHPSSRRGSFGISREHVHPSTLGGFGSDIPRPGTAEQGITSHEKEVRPQIAPGRSFPPWRRRDGWTGWARESIITANLVPALVLQAFSTGILDATTYADFKTFASNQTGNTILLTVSVIGDLNILLLLTGISLAAFLGGAFIFGHIGHIMGVRRRLWILTSTTYQIFALTISAVLVSPAGPAVTQIGGKHEWAVLFLFANMSGAQVAMARQSGSQELPTAPMTSSYVDLMADKYIFVGFRHPKAGPRNRRLAYILAMIIGGFIGSAIHKYAGSWAVVIVTIGLKMIVILMMVTVQAEAQPKSESKV